MMHRQWRPFRPVRKIRIFLSPPPSHTLFHPFFIPISTIFYFVLPSGRLIFRVDATVPPYFRYVLYSPVRRWLPTGHEKVNRHLRPFATIVSQIIAHYAQNVSFATNNVNGLDHANRSEKAGRRAKSACGAHSLGDRKSCKRYRNSCNAYSARRITPPFALSRCPFLAKSKHHFININQTFAIEHRPCHFSTKSKAPCLRYLRQLVRRWLSRPFSMLSDVKKRVAHYPCALLFAPLILYPFHAGLHGLSRSLMWSFPYPPSVLGIFVWR